MDGDDGEGEVQGDLLATWAEMPRAPGARVLRPSSEAFGRRRVRRFRRRNLQALLCAEDGRAVTCRRAAISAYT
jgi:hypothetical protein